MSVSLITGCKMHQNAVEAWKGTRHRLLAGVSGCDSNRVRSLDMTEDNGLISALWLWGNSSGIPGVVLMVMEWHLALARRFIGFYFSYELKIRGEKKNQSSI